MSLFDPTAENKTLTLDNGASFTIGVGDILRHADWDKIGDEDRFVNRHLYRVTGFSTLPKDGSPAVLLRQIAHPMREYMYTFAQLQTKLDPAKYPMAIGTPSFIPFRNHFLFCTFLLILHFSFVQNPISIIAHTSFEIHPLFAINPWHFVCFRLSYSVFFNNIIHILIASAGKINQHGTSAHGFCELHTVRNRM